MFTLWEWCALFHLVLGSNSKTNILLPQTIYVSFCQAIPCFLAEHVNQEMFSGTFPFAGRKNDTQVIAAIMRDEFPERTLNVFTDGLWELLLRCWQRDPPKRPTAREVLVTLQDLHRLQSDCIDST